MIQISLFQYTEIDKFYVSSLINYYVIKFNYIHIFFHLIKYKIVTFLLKRTLFLDVLFKLFNFSILNFTKI